MNLIVVSHLTTNEGLYFRYLTMMAAKNICMNILVETQAQQRDYYYKLLKQKGLNDYVMDFVTPDEREEGIRLDTESNFPLTVTTENICSDNVAQLILQIKSLALIKQSL
tara:strand:+ start:1439 stop:1768 length:330 start_codon:yes stop_codon:yes gene_type:complete